MSSFDRNLSRRDFFKTGIAGAAVGSFANLESVDVSYKEQEAGLVKDTLKVVDSTTFQKTGQ